jgi:glycosyltransferase involved in cell wall biosynthesis
VQSEPRVKILISTYNGQDWLQEQITSLQSQIGVNIEIVIRDDGSTDRTIDILKDIGVRVKFRYYLEENVGAAKSFLRLVETQDCEEYMGFADQDDIWFPDKLKIATSKLSDFEHLPALYCSNVQFMSSGKLNGKISDLPIPGLPLNFFQNSAMGCTIVFNKKAHDLIRTASGQGMVMHDWYLFLVIAMTGKVFFDPQPTMFYRLHSMQTVGWKRRRTLRTIFSKRIFEQSIAQLRSINTEFSKDMNNDSREFLESLLRIVDSPRRMRLSILLQHKFRFRQNILEDIWVKIRLVCL